ncbi:MAG: protein disulfide oxidoreductase [Epsilonproteobacteria bacterium]|nr:protein disulfide oxidoreductase [Campylobacterota bacterium]
MFKNWTFKRILKEIVTTLLIFFVASLIINYLRQPDTFNVLPNETMRTIEKKDISLEKYKTKPLIVYFWGSWCPACRQQSPNIDVLSKEYQVLTIAVKSGTDDEIKAYMSEKKLSFETINDENGELAKKFGVSIYPTMLIYDSTGTHAFSETGYTTVVGAKARLNMIK